VADSTVCHFRRQLADCMCCFVLLNRYWGIVFYGPGVMSAAFLSVCASTQLARQLHQERTQMEVQ